MNARALTIMNWLLMGLVPRSILASPEHVIGKICSSSSASSSCTTIQLDFFFFVLARPFPNLPSLHLLLTYVFIYLLTYLVTYLLTYLLTYLFIFIHFFTYLFHLFLTYLLITYLFTLFLFFVFIIAFCLFFSWFTNVFPYCTTLALKTTGVAQPVATLQLLGTFSEEKKQVSAGKTRKCICVQVVPSISNTRALRT